MYIEQGYRGEIGLWKYFIIPLGFISLLIFNYIATLNSPVDMDVMMQKLIEDLGRNLVLVFLLAPLVIGLVLILAWTFLVHRQSITSLTTSRRRIDWKRVFSAFFIWAIITTVLVFLDIYLSPEDYQWNFDLKKFVTLAFLGILLIPLQTSFEEYLFRGYLMQGIGIMTGNRWIPLLVTSFLFGIMHIANPEVAKMGYGILIFYIGTGFFLGILTLMDEGLELALGFHAANNLTAALLVTADWTAFSTDSLFRDVSEPVLGWDVLIPVFVIYPLLLLFFSKNYGWKDWTERLTGKVQSKEEFLTENLTERHEI